MTLLELLIKVRARIDKPQKWCSYWWQSEDGRRLGIDGAIGLLNTDERDAYDVLAKHSGINAKWNSYDRVVHVDTHKGVMAMLDKAIVELQEVENAKEESL